MFIGGSWSVLVNEQRTAAVLWSHTKRHSRFFFFFHKTWPTVNRPVSIDSREVPLDCSWSRRFLIHPRVAYALFCSNLLIFVQFFFFPFYMDLRVLGCCLFFLCSSSTLSPYTLFCQSFVSFLFPLGRQQRGTKCHFKIINSTSSIENTCLIPDSLIVSGDRRTRSALLKTKRPSTVITTQNFSLTLCKTTS